MINLEKGESIIEEYTNVDIKGLGLLRISQDIIYITTKALLLYLDKEKNTIRISFKKILNYKKENELILVKYLNEKGLQKEVSFNIYKSSFLCFSTKDISTEFYNSLHNIISRFGVEIQEETNYCGECGTKLKDKAKFCKKCGKKIK